MRSRLHTRHYPFILQLNYVNKPPTAPTINPFNHSIYKGYEPKQHIISYVITYPNGLNYGINEIILNNLIHVFILCN